MKNKKEKRGKKLKIDSCVIFFIISCFLLTIFLTLISAYSNLELNSTSYSGQPTQGASGGNLTDSIYAGDSASFYQTAAGYINDLFYSGVHNFWFQIPSANGYVPILSIIIPKNGTYITPLNLFLNFTATTAQNILYNIDNGQNSTISANTTFNTTSGQHTLYLFANNSYGSSSANVTFTVNASKFMIYYSNYSGNGSSTDFNKTSYEDMQNLSNIVLENTNAGKIIFNNPINLTADSDPNDGVLNLNNNTNISQNYIYVNSTALPNFNMPATLYLYNLSFANPQILKDGSLCSASICTKINYSQGTLVFNVTGFSSYSAQETPLGGSTPTPAPSSGGAGGAGGPVLFTVDQSQISVSVKQGEVVMENLTITNTGTQFETLKIDNNLPDFIVRSDASITLNPGGSKTIELYVLARVDTPPNLYLGKITISSGGVSKEILVAINVQSKGNLFDVAVDIPTQYQTISQGNNLLANIKIYNLGAVGTVDANVNYIIKDEDGNTITTSSDTIAVQTQTSYTKTINIPKDASFGQYVLYVSVNYNGKIASSSIFFNVGSTVSQQEKIYIIAIVVLSIVLSLVIYYAVINREKHGKKGGKKIIGGAKVKEEKFDLKRLLKE